MESEKERSRQMMDQAKLLKLVATLLAVILFLGVIAIGVWMVMKNPNLLPR
jgi:flagellar biogenesis protein FliO